MYWPVACMSTFETDRSDDCLRTDLSVLKMIVSSGAIGSLNALLLRVAIFSCEPRAVSTARSFLNSY